MLLQETCGLVAGLVPVPLLKVGTSLPGSHVCCPGIEIMLSAIGQTFLQEVFGKWIITGHDRAAGQIGIGSCNILLPSSFKGKMQASFHVSTSPIILGSEQCSS